MLDITNQVLSKTGSVEEKPDTEVEIEETDGENVSVDEAQASAQDNEEVEQEETPAQRSWKELRAQAEEGKKTKKELAEAYRLLQMMQQQQQQYKQPQAPAPVEEEEFDFNSLPDEEYTDNKQLKKILKQQQKYYKKLEDNFQKSQKQTYLTSVESRIRSEFPDFNEVVSADNVEVLKEKRPSIFKSLSYNPDTYEQAVGAYEAIKEFGIYKPNNYQREEYQMAKNLNKPKASSSIGTQKKKSALDDISRYNNPSSDDLKTFYEDAIIKSGRSMSYNS